jgi:hypothetical protein
VVGTADIEILIQDASAAEVIGWLEARLGPLVETEVVDGIHYLGTVDDRARVVVTPNMEDGPFLSVYVRGAQLPWPGSAALAIACAVELGKTVRWCDPAANRWMEKQGTRPPQVVPSSDD